jgi:hypothetical protein
MNDEKRIPVTDKSSGKQRFTDPVRQQTPRESATLVSVTPSAYVASEPRTNPQGLTHSSTQDAVEVDSSSNGESGTKTKTKAKQEIATLEQFIAYAYGRKGHPLSAKPRVLQEISPNTVISVEGLAALQRLAFADKQFCVPRQILLATLDIEGYPAIKEALRSFVQGAMLWHPIFRNAMVQAAIRNLPDAPKPNAAMRLVMTEVVEKDEQDEKDSDRKEGDKVAKKSVDPDELRMNAANCLAVWFSISRHLSLEEVTEALNEAVWGPAGRVADHDSSKLRALTSIEHAGGVGLACELYKRRAVAHATDAVRASAEVNGLRASLTEAQLQLERTSEELQESTAALEKLKGETALELAAMHQANETQAAHLRDDLEQLRSRLLRRLVADVSMLGVGLSALQTPKPESRIHVITDRVERVIDALQSEINKLREE